MHMDLDPIVSASCEDCGITLVMDADLVSIVELDGEFTGITLCFHCERPIMSIIPRIMVRQLSEKGVKIFSWTNKEMDL